MNPHTGKGANVSNPYTWGTYKKAKQAVENFVFDGIGFVLINGYAGIDLDHVVRSDGSLEAYAVEIVREMDSYTELSPSRTGLHILFKLKKTLIELFGSNCKHGKAGREIYDDKKYFTVTGNIFSVSKNLEERSEAVKIIYYKYFDKKDT